MLSRCNAACQSTTVPRGRCRRQRARNARCTVLLAAAVDRFGRPASHQSPSILQNFRKIVPLLLPHPVLCMCVELIWTRLFRIGVSDIVNAAEQSN
ncbi:unnamed protein product [Sphagnum balticum]